jgi:ParB-like chromosome segregation protein Spo0J
MQTTNISLSKLIPYAGNPRKNDHAVEQVAEAIKRFGFRVPVLAKSDGTLIDGHLRVKAAQVLGMKDVPAIVCDDLSDADVRALRISINRLATLADWDSDLLGKELAALTANGVGIEALGFDSTALESLGVTLDADSIDAVFEGGSRGQTASDKLDIYENTTVRQIVLIMDVHEFGAAMNELDAIKQKRGLDTNTEAALAAIKAYANADA